jgi:DNA-binding IclR family transcriptional regulator
LPGSSSVALSHKPVEPSDLTSEKESHIVGTLRNSFGTAGASFTNLLEASGLPKTTFYNALNALVRKGLLVNLGTPSRTRYVIAADQE